MAETQIEWVKGPDGTPGKVWNPVTGCSPVSEGCQNCYARAFAHRLRGRFGYPADEPFRVTLHPERLGEPLRWRKPRRVFVASMGDLFHPDVPDTFLDRVFDVMHEAQDCTFLLLTKRPERMAAYIASLGDVLWWEHVWVGVTAENQARADERIPILLETPAAVHWVSCEPLLAPIDLRRYLRFGRDYYPCPDDNCAECGLHYDSSRDRFLDWVVVGGETGPGARPCHPDWVRSLRDQCQESGTAFFFKSWGEWFPRDQWEDNTDLVLPDDDVAYTNSRWTHVFDSFDGPLPMHRVGKTRAGRLLDGEEWNEFPAGGETCRSRV